MSTRNITVDQIKKSIIKSFDDPMVLGSKVQIFNEQEATEYHKILIPGIKKLSNWEKIKTIRPCPPPKIYPSGLERPDSYDGVDMVIHTYENILWEEYDRILKVTITYENGEITDICHRIKW